VAGTFCPRVGGKGKTTNKRKKSSDHTRNQGRLEHHQGQAETEMGQFTDDALRYAEGQQEELLGRIQKRTGETREAVEKAVKESCSTCGS